MADQEDKVEGTTTTTTPVKSTFLSDTSKQLEEWGSMVSLATTILCVILLLFIVVSLYRTGGIPVLHGIHTSNLASISKVEAFSIENPVTKGKMYF